MLSKRAMAATNQLTECKIALEQAAQTAIEVGEKQWEKAKARRRSPVDTIYHYTNAKSALEIFKSGNLWFTERSHVNDPSEIQFGIKVAIEVAKELENKQRLESPTISNWLEFVQSKIYEPHAYYVASFSSDGDSLPQWQAYADDGRGVALGFSVTAFDQDRPGSAVLGKPPSTFLIRYSRMDLKRFQRQLIQLVLPTLKNGALDSELQKPLALYVILNSIQFKHAAYEHEQEFRALVLGDRKKIARHRLHDVRERTSELVEYLERPIYPSLKKLGVLKHIRIGPAAPEGLIQQVKNALWSLRIPEPAIDKSEIPYRSIRAT